MFRTGPLGASMQRECGMLQFVGQCRRTHLPQSAAHTITAGCD